MAKKPDFRKQDGDVFGAGGSSVVDTSWMDADAGIFGQIAALDDGKIIARPISIFEITPDPAQPRRAVPLAVRQGWQGQPDQMQALFLRWIEAVHHERGMPDFDLALYLSEEDDNPGRIEDPGPVEAAFLRVIELAVSIRREGLANPISVAKEGARFVIETGERRWLAHHLLYAFFHEERERWEKIAAREVKEFSPWRQAAENNARANLNAIAKARQLALLLMALHNSSALRPMSAFQHEQDFYAQVADAKEWRTPTGKSELLTNVMGLEHRNAIQRYRALLALPHEVWELADDHHWPEGRLRPLTPPTPASDAVRIARQWAKLSPIGDNLREAPARFDHWNAKGLKRLDSDLEKMTSYEREALLDRLTVILEKYRR